MWGGEGVFTWILIRAAETRTNDGARKRKKKMKQQLCLSFEFNRFRPCRVTEGRGVGAERRGGVSRLAKRSLGVQMSEAAVEAPVD